MINNLKPQVINPPITAEAGMVRIQAQTIFLANDQRTAETRLEAPTPIIAVEIT